MKYRNTKTGAIIDSPCVISGGDWVAEETPKVVKEAVKEIQVEAVAKAVAKEVVKEVGEQEIVEEEIVEEEIEGIEGITTKEIKQELDAFGIKYNPRAKKQELYDLMIKGR